VKQWDTASQKDATADAVIDELLRKSVIDEQQHRWIAGHMSDAEAEVNGFVYRPEERFVAILSMVLAEDAKRLVNGGIRQMIPTGPISVTERIAVAIELAMRPFRSAMPQDEVSRMRTTLLDVLSEALFLAPESSDGSRKNKRLVDIQGKGETIDDLVEAALEAIADPKVLLGRRIGLLALPWLTIQGLLVRVDGRSVKNPKRPRAIFTHMIKDPLGLRMLYQVVCDSRAGIAPRRVDITGAIVLDEHGNEERITAPLLRELFATTNTDTEIGNELDALVLPADRLRHLAERAATDLRSALDKLNEAATLRDSEGRLVCDVFALEDDKMSQASMDAMNVQMRLAGLRASTDRLKLNAHAALDLEHSAEELAELEAAE
jgi:hypothetical protein